MDRRVASKGPRLLALILVVLMTGWVQARSCQEYLQEIQHLLSSLDKLKSYLVQQAASLMVLMAGGPMDRYFEEKLLCNYNYMRKLSNLSQASSVQEIDKAWVQEEDYQRWIKKELKVKRGTPLPELMQILATQVSDNLEHPEKEKDPSLVLYPYNRLRELLGQPRISSVKKVDKVWLDKVLYDADLAALIEEGYSEPTVAQKKLIEAEIRRLKLEMPAVTLAYPREKGGSTGLLGGKRVYLSLCKNPDLDTRLQVLYHELGHIKHKDVTRDIEINAGTKTISDVRAEKDFAADVKNIQHYLQLGWAAIPSLQKTSLGKYLYKLLHYDDPKSEAKELIEKGRGLWIPPKNNKEKEKFGYIRETEERADLFALRELYKQGRMDAILTTIDYYLHFEDRPLVIEQGKITHPSDVERALYIIGFLVAHDVHVPQVLYEWETKGMCIPAEEEHAADSLVTLHRP
jgi:hypothetical protein